MWINCRERFFVSSNAANSFFATGDSPERAIKEISEHFRVSKHNAGRLVMTESAYFSSAAQKECFNELEVERYEIVGTFDKHMCPICGRLDGKVLDMKEFKEGITAPPFHPNCRCCTAPYFEELEDVGRRFARDVKTGKAYTVPGNTTYEQWKQMQNEKYEKHLAFSKNDGIINSGAISGALKPDSKRAQDHADRYYELVRHMKNDVEQISKNTSFDIKKISEIKDFIFYQKHDLGNGVPEYFYPSYEMAQSWQRLIDGKNIQKHDITLLQHEIMEKQLIENGYSQTEAHNITEKKFNYSKEAKEYYANIDKHGKN